MNQYSPIGVFDSGVGGISVLRILRHDMPNENYIFFGDSIHAPYGDKSEDQIRALSDANVQFLLKKGCKAIVIACNTATSAAADWLRAKYPSLIIIGMEPAVKSAVDHADITHPRVLVLATASTIHGERLHHLIGRFSEAAEIHPVAAPGIVPLVEAGKEHSEEMFHYLQELLRPYRRFEDGGGGQLVDSVVLGCTHFPFAMESIERALGYSFTFYDGAYGTAREAKRRLQEAGLLNSSTDPGTLELHSSIPGDTQIKLQQKLLQLPFRYAPECMDSCRLKE